jgi:NADH dehydrogenase
MATTLSWIGTFVGSKRGQLTITEQQAYARTRIEQLEEIVAEVEGEDDEATETVRADDSATVAS